MVDSVQILDAGWQMPIKPSTQLTYADGIIYFFTAGTTTPLTVYSDANLSVSLGVSVSCNSSGFPVSSGNAKTLIYTGTASYKIQITSVDYGGVIFEADFVKGALDTSIFLTSAAVARESVVAESTNRAVGLSDLGKLIDVNCSAGALTMTIDDASDLGDGWWVDLRHNGTANQVKVTGNGTDTFGLNGVNVTSFSLTGRGQVTRIICNGTSFKIAGQVPALIGNTIGVILIADRLSAPPGAPNPGERYIVTSAPTGAWATFAAGDIAEATGFATWFKYTPPASCGWRAFVQDEEQHYSFRNNVWSADGALSSVQTLVITNNSVTPNTQIDVSCSDAFIGVRTGPVTVTINAAVTGENGLDTGALANNTWYNIWLISNGLTTAGLMSTSATAPTMPSGYIYKYRLGAFLTGGAATFHRMIIRGSHGQYRPTSGSVTTIYPDLLTPGAGAFPQTITVSTFYPPTASRVKGYIFSQSVSGHIASIAPNNFIAMFLVQCSVGGTNTVATFDIAVEGVSIFGGTTGANAIVKGTAWIDTVNAS